MSRGKGRRAIIPRHVVDKVAKPGQSPGERRNVARQLLQHERLRRNLISAGQMGSFGKKPDGKVKARRKASKQARKRNR